MLRVTKMQRHGVRLHTWLVALSLLRASHAAHRKLRRKGVNFLQGTHKVIHSGAILFYYLHKSTIRQGTGIHENAYPLITKIKN